MGHCNIRARSRCVQTLRVEHAEPPKPSRVARLCQADTARRFPARGVILGGKAKKARSCVASLLRVILTRVKR